MNLPTHDRDAFFTGFIIFAVLAILTLVYSSTAISLYRGWVAQNSLQSHGLILLPLSVYLLIREWYANRRGLEITYRPLYWIVLLLGSIAWLLTDLAKIQLLSQVILILILWLSLVALFGFSRTLRLGFPILLLLSATPGWSILAQPLQVPTAYLVNQMLHLTGYASFQEGYFISIPEGVFEVGDTCSGLRYQIAALTLALIYSFASGFTWVRGAIFLLLAAGVAFLSNAIRIYIVVLSGHYTQMTHSLLDDHIWLGWVVFALCFAGFMFLSQRLERGRAAEQPKNLADSLVSVGYAPVRSLSIAAIIVLSASAGPLYRQWILDRPTCTRVDQSALQLQDSGLVASKISQDWEPLWINPDGVAKRRYILSQGEVDFYAAYYACQDQGKEVVSDLNHAYSPGVWQTEGKREVTFSLSDARKIPIMEERISQKNGSNRVLWSWYYVGGYVTSSPLRAKFLSVLSALNGRHDAAVVMISTVQTKQYADAREILHTFLEQTIGEIEHRFRDSATISAESN
ncbi:MAG: EpsI family protein [Candidatus Thiodiazotropha sp.]